MESQLKSKISLVSLGCPKNLVDSEVILGLLQKCGFEICDDVNKAHIILVNTCAFIKEAKEESIDLILELARLKKESQNKYLLVVGCLVQRYLCELTDEIPEVDRWITLSEIPKIPFIINKLINPASACRGGINKENIPSSKLSTPVPSSFLYDHLSPRSRITPSHYTYVKIAEGCSNRCSYCAVPNIKGNYRSRNIDSIFMETKQLVDHGTKEINLIAQDTTSYGMDLSAKPNLAQLLNRLCTIENLKWLRILYTHPAYFTEELALLIAEQLKICKYIDFPLQHIDDKILRRMERKIDSKHIKDTINMIRATIPDVIIRTSFIVGFPGETEKQFCALLKFMEEIKFDRLGIFTYSHEEGTPAYNMSGQIPEPIKEKRFHKAMQLQQDISKEVNQKFLNKKLEIIVEGFSESRDNVWCGRSYADAPEVDGMVYIINNNTSFKEGDIITAKITDTMEYDLVGEPI